MATTTSWTSTDIAKLEASIAAGRGAKSIQFSDQVVVFHSLDEQRRLLADMRQQVNASTRSGFRLAAFSKGV